MRIDAYNQVTQLYNVQQSVKNSKTQASGYAMGRDELSISQAGRDYQVAKKAVSEVSDVREDKIAALKAKINAGKYSVDPASFANKLLETYNSALF
uniref:flagellar biosynthesis anti-sigma factor FlgM n=1 Tax=Agathobacter sp. TaxID=2021311 RepID=UPI004057B109